MLSLRSRLSTDADTERQYQLTYHHGKLGSFLAYVVSSILISYLLWESTTSDWKRWYQLASLAILMILLTMVPLSTRETVNIIKGLGIELLTTYPFSLKPNQHRFIPTQRLLDVVILEGFKGLQVIFYLACVVADDTKLALPLPNAGLRLDDIKKLRSQLLKRLTK